MGLKGTNQEFGRPYNRRIVLETIRLHGPLARGDIATRVGLTVQTVSNIIRELEDMGFVAGSREQPKGRGYPATNLKINPDGGHSIGVNVTPIGLGVAMVNLAGEVVARVDQMQRPRDPEIALQDIATLVGRLQEQQPGKRILGIGLAMPGPFDVESMSFVGPTTLEGWKGFPVQQRLAQVSRMPAFIEVDHAAAALGERLYGAGQRFRDFYYLYFGVGLGGCMVQEGQPLRGAFGNAGEIGHLPSVPNGEFCPCGNQGCLERYVSFDAFERRSKAVGAEAWLAEAVPLLRAAIVTIENLFDPETVIVGGLAGSDILSALLDRIEPLPNSVSKRRERSHPRVTRSFGSPDAVLRGAAALAISGVLSPRLGTMFAHGDAHDPMLKPVEAA